MDEDEDEDGPVTPFWLSSSNNTHRKSNRNLRRRSSSLLLNSTVLLVLLSVIAIVFMFIIIPSILNAISQIFKPRLVKKCWDSLNLVLVLFAVVCAFLGRNSNDENRDASFDGDRSNVASISPRNLNKWHENADWKGNRSFNKLKSSNSYPDLRKESSLMAGDAYQFLDDTHLNDRRFSDQDLLHQQRWRSSIAPPSDLSPPPQQQKQKEEVKRETKRTYRALADEKKLEKPMKSEWELKKSTHLPAPLPPVTLSNPPPPSSQLMRVKRKTDRTSRAQAHDEQLRNHAETEIDFRKSITPPPSPPPPLPTPSVKKIGRSDRKRSGSSSTKDLLTLLYQQRRKKKQRQKSVENFDTLLPPTEPPSPPPPPPQSAFQNKFNPSKLKAKIDPPPPQQSMSNKPKTSTQKSSLPVTLTKYDLLDDNTSSGNESPHSSIPPPPPLPPFRIKNWKFVVKGDYVRINSNGSSSSDSPDLDYDGRSSNNESNLSTSAIEDGDSPPSQPVFFCPSPDVNSKADKFIARFRAGLKLEKVNSINDKQGIGLSKLGPEPKPNSSPDIK